MSHDGQQNLVSTHNLKSQFPSVASCTRREFAKRSLAALPGVGLLSVLNRASAADTSPGKPNSKFAGVQIEIVKVDGLFKMTDDELDYAFTVAKTLGGRAISTEISNKDADLKRVGQFADKHGLMVGYHGHATTKPEHWEKAFSLARHNGANVDLGHFVAGNNVSPAGFIKQH